MIASVKKMLSKEQTMAQYSSKDYLSSGSTLLNLACAGRVFGAFLKGHYYFLFGDSDSGKTFLTLTCMAEAAINPNFDDYRFIFDDAEDGALMDKARFFGAKMLDRLEPPAGTINNPRCSSNIEELYYNLDDANKVAKVGRPFIYLLDSMDALSSKAEAKKFNQQKLAHRKNRAEPGSYGDGKAKVNSSNLRRIVSDLRSSGSILFIIAQRRDSMDPFEDEVFSGGRSLKFYATLQMFSSQRRLIKKKITDKKKLQQGIIARVRVKKNRIMGRDRTVEIPIYNSFGIDDLESCIDFLLEWGHWGKAKGGLIDATELKLRATKENLIHAIEEANKERALRKVVGKVWREIESKAEVQRKRRYQ